MKTKRIIQIALVAMASPLVGYWVFYFYRWCMIGKWVEGGGDRAMAACLVSFLILLPAVLIEIE